MCAVKKDPHFIASETPFYIRRAVAALASDPDVAQPEGYFTDIVRSYLNGGKGRSGTVGQARSYLLDAAELHQYAVESMERRWGS